MKRISLFGLLLLLFVVAAAGCGSSSGSSESSEGSGTVATAFISSGDAVIKLLDGTIIETGTINNSRFSFKTEQKLPRPFIVETSEATFSNGQPLRSPLSRVVQEGETLSEVHVTLFSSIHAKAYVQAYELGQDAPAVADAVLAGVFDSLGLDMTVEQMSAMDPVRDPDLEFAQQALMAVLELSDEAGVMGFEEKISSKILAEAASAGVNYNSGDFMGEFTGDEPGLVVANAKDDIISNVRKTFQQGHDMGATSVTAGEAESAARVEGDNLKDSDTPVALAVEEPERVTTRDVVLSDIRVVLGSLGGTELTGAAYKITAESTGIKVVFANAAPAKDSGEWSYGWNATNAEELDGTKKLHVLVPADLTPGDHVVTLATTGSPSLTCTLAVEVLDDDDVTVSEVVLKQQYEYDNTIWGGKGYLGFAPPIGSTVVSNIPESSTALFNNVGDTAKDTPELLINVTSIGAPTGDDVVYFDIHLSAPEGIAFVTGSTVVSTRTEEIFTIGRNATGWIVHPDYTDAIEVTYASNIPEEVAVSFKDNMFLAAMDTVEIGPASFVAKVMRKDQARVLVNDLMPIYLLNCESANYLADLGSLARIASGGGKTKGTITIAEHASADTEVVHELQTMATYADAKTWEDLTGVENPATRQNPGKAFLFPSSRNQDGSYKAVFEKVPTGQPSGLLQNNLEVPVTESDLEWSTPAGFDQVNLNVVVGENKDNYEGVDLEIWYENPDGAGTDTWIIRNNKGLRYYSPVEAP